MGYTEMYGDTSPGGLINTRLVSMKIESPIG